MQQLFRYERIVLLFQTLLIILKQFLPQKSQIHLIELILLLFIQIQITYHVFKMNTPH